jgi:hypothetical protein
MTTKNSEGKGRKMVKYIFIAFGLVRLEDLIVKMLYKVVVALLALNQVDNIQRLSLPEFIRTGSVKSVITRETAFSYSGGKWLRRWEQNSISRFDLEGRLIEEAVSGFRGIASYRYLYSYDKFNNLAKKKHCHSGGSLCDKYIYVYDSGNKLKQIVRQKADGTSVVNRILQYDEQSRLSEETTYEDGQLCFRKTRRYEITEGTVEEVLHGKSGEVISKLVSVSSNDGLHKKIYKYDSVGTLIDQIEYTYDRKGMLIERLKHYFKEKFVAKDVYVYNERGLLAETLSYRSDSPSSRREVSTYRFDSRGNPVMQEILWFDEAGKVVSKRKIHHRIEYF